MRGEYIRTEVIDTETQQNKSGRVGQVGVICGDRMSREVGFERRSNIRTIYCIYSASDISPNACGVGGSEI